MQNLEELNVLKDSILGIEKLKAIEKLQIAFDVEKKDAEITLLQKDKQIQKIEKDNLLKLQMIFIVSGVLLLLLLGALFNRFKNSQKLLKTISKKNTENELLVQEIHHRVKNNLQIVLSLLGSYADRKDTDDNTIQILTETQNKIKSMALIHQNLYGNGNFNSTLATHYFRNLIDNIRQTYIGTKSKNIKVITSIEEVSLETKMAIPLGLIVNELLTNAYKYAFENIEDNNQVDISFSKSDKNILHLNIKDNGIGLASTFDLKNVESFGMQIVQGLVQQLGGQMDVTTEPGTNYNINIPL